MNNGICTVAHRDAAFIRKVTHIGERKHEGLPGAHRYGEVLKRTSGQRVRFRSGTRYQRNKVVRRDVDGGGPAVGKLIG